MAPMIAQMTTASRAASYVSPAIQRSDCVALHPQVMTRSAGSTSFSFSKDSLGNRAQKLLVGRGHGAVLRLRRRSSQICMSLQDGSGSKFHEDDPAYAVASIVEAVEVMSGRDGFVIKMTNGHRLACRHHASQGGTLPESMAQAAMVLRLEDGSDIMLPIIVMEQPCQTLIDALKNVPLTRPTVYQVMKDMVAFMGYELKLVRITHRVCEAYYARAYLCKAGGGAGSIVSLDMRPSDAINLAARAKVPIQVNKVLAQGDGVVPMAVPTRSGSLAKLGSMPFSVGTADRPDNESCTAAKEFSLVRSVTVAAMLERYGEAARLRDELLKFREANAAGGVRAEAQAKPLQEQDQAGENDRAAAILLALRGPPLLSPAESSAPFAFSLASYPELQAWLEQCTEMARRLAAAFKDFGRDEAIADARRRFTLLLER